MEKIKKAINVCLRKTRKWFNKNNAIVYMLVITAVGIIAKQCEGNNIEWIFAMICAFLCFMILYFIKEEIKKIDSTQYKPKERFTHKDSEGNVTVSSDKIKQALIYLSIIEDSLNE